MVDHPEQPTASTFISSTSLVHRGGESGSSPMANYLENKKDVILMNEKNLTHHEPNASTAKVSIGSERKKSETNLNNYGALDL